MCLCLLDVCPTCAPLSSCVFCNTRKSLSELGAMTQEETGSPERGQQDALADIISTPTHRDTEGTWRRFMELYKGYIGIIDQSNERA